MSIKRISIGSILFLATLFLNTGVCSPAGSVKWYDFNSGLAAAARLKRPIVVDFYADWCHWCKVMDKDTFSNAAVAQKLNNEFIAIKVISGSNTVISYKNNKYSPDQFSRALGITGLPTMLFMDKNGELITKVPGFIPTDTFLPILNYIQNECYRKNISFQDFKQNPGKCK